MKHLATYVLDQNWNPRECASDGSRLPFLVQLFRNGQGIRVHLDDRFEVGVYLESRRKLCISSLDENCNRREDELLVYARDNMSRSHGKIIGH